jgi:hypothetical protein
MYLATILVNVALRMLKKTSKKYDANTNSCITMINLTLKIKKKLMIFIDQCAVHVNDITFLRNIKDVFFPCNCTSQLMVSIFIHKNIIMTDGRLLHDVSCKKLDVLSDMNFTAGPLKLMPTTIKSCVTKCGFPVDHF